MSELFPESNDASLQAWMREATELKTALDEHAIVSITDPQGRITFVNDKFCELAKYSREQLIGRDHRLLNSGYHPSDFFRDLWETIYRGAVWHGEVRNRASDGTFFWVALTVVPFLDDFGQPRRFLSIQADITERRRIEEELAAKLTLQKLLADISAKFVAAPTIALDHSIVETQRLIVETLKLDRSTLWQLSPNGAGFVLTHCWQRPGSTSLQIGLSSGDLFPWATARIIDGQVMCFTSMAELPPEAAKDVESYQTWGGPRSNLTIPLLANGRVFGALAFATLANERSWREDEIAELKLVAQIISNVLGRQRAELREAQLRNELAHAMRIASLGELAATLAHELNQPLAAILSNAQAARRFISSGNVDLKELREILDDIVRDDKRAGNVIHHLRRMVSKCPSGRESCSLNSLVREVVQLIKGALIEAKVEIRAALEPELPKVSAAKVELQQVVVNLLLNALHAMVETPAASRFIEITTHSDHERVFLTVRDRGHGIAPEQVADLFAPFRTTKPNGLGLGLSICKRIVEGHGGGIGAQSYAECGASFTFWVPRS